MRTTISNLLMEADKDQLYDIINVLCNKHKNLEDEIEFILNPREIKKPQSYYNRLVKKAIDTNSWSKFLDKGIKGLDKMVAQVEFLYKIGNLLESQKLIVAILGVIEKCKKKYNNKNTEELKSIKSQVEKYSFS